MAASAAEEGPLDLTGDGKILKTVVRRGQGKRLSDGSLAVGKRDGTLLEAANDDHPSPFLVHLKLM
jgi:hypothetical protein